jgi:hypothetical protein
MTAWTEHIKDFAKRKGMTYGCALSDPECSKEYKDKRPPKLNKKEKKEVSGMEAQDTNVAQKENIQMVISEAKKGRGRPKKYETDEERKKAKSAKTIESNKRKRAEKKAKGEGMPIPIITKKIGGKPNPMSDPVFAKKYMEEKAKKEAEGKGIMEAIKKNNEFKEKVVEALPPPMKRMVRQIKETKKLLDDNKAKIMAENMKTGSSKGGGGLVATPSTEGTNGLTHIYPLTHARVLEMCKHLI